jgi:hypothetical protein
MKFKLLLSSLHRIVVVFAETQSQSGVESLKQRYRLDGLFSRKKAPPTTSLSLALVSNLVLGARLVEALCLLISLIIAPRDQQLLEDPKRCKPTFCVLQFITC